MSTATIVEWKQEKKSQQAFEESSKPDVVIWDDPTPSPKRIARLAHQDLDAEIAHARSVLDRKNELDEEILSEETLERAVAFLQLHFTWLWQTCGVKAPVPVIGFGPNKSVDIFWKRSSWELLVNIPASRETKATFYGDDYGWQKTKGSFDPLRLAHNVVAWLMT